ncbi:MAG: UDP-3-O-(3-hydroxymyristoyl)glucosamine N-acyltransferase [Bdellovibrionales bacterium]|nr:UDP-3-O-(3-hydroxymyristoyl)glucosamine N-acyltransferase [Bdellovibrionales bacterium]
MPDSAKTRFEFISAADAPQKDSIVFANKASLITGCVEAGVAGLVVSSDLVEDPALNGFSGSLFHSPSPKLAMAKVAQTFFDVTFERQPFDGERIHPTAVISKSAELADDVIVGPNAVIGSDCKISKGCYIGAGTVLEPNCKIGENCTLRAQVFLGFGTILGNNCEIHPKTSVGTEGFGYAQDQHFNHHHIPHRGHVVLEDNVDIGAGCVVDRGTFAETRFGEGTIIDNLCHFGHNFVCGKKCIITGGAMIAGSVTMGDSCVLGGRVTLNGHINICSQVVIAGMSGVTNHVTEPGRYGGYPIQKLKDSLRSLSSLAHLPEMRRQLKSLLDSQ